MMTQTAEEVALNFMRHIVLQYGIPGSLVTDQGTQFMGDVFKSSYNDEVYTLRNTVW